MVVEGWVDGVEGERGAGWDGAQVGATAAVAVVEAPATRFWGVATVDPHITDLLSMAHAPYELGDVRTIEYDSDPLISPLMMKIKDDLIS